MPAKKSKSEPQLSKRPSPGIRLNLAGKGLVMLGLPLLFQMGFIGVLFYLHDRAEAYAVRAGNSRNFSSDLSSFSTSAYAAMFQIDDALWHHKPVDAAGIQEVANFVREANDLKVGLHNKAVTDSLFAPIDPANRKTISENLLEWLDQLEKRKKTDVPPTPFENHVRQRVDQMLVDIDDMVRMTDVAASAAPDSPQHKQAFERVQDHRHVIAAGLKDTVLLAPDKIRMSPEYWARDREHWFLLLVAGCVANLGMVIAMALFFSRDIVQRVFVMLDNSMRLAMQRPLHPQLGGGDEISQLDRAFHDMADALTDAMEKQRALIDNAQDVICSLDESGKFAAVNSASKTVFGYDSEDLVGSSLFNLLPDEDFATIRAKLKDIKEGSTDHFEVRMIRKDRKVIDLLWSVSWSPMEETFFCVAHDITERKGAERLRQEVMQMVSHDLRTPLATMQGFHEMLGEGTFGALDDQGKKLLQVADSSTGRMLRLINDLLDIEKMESGSLQLNISHIELRPIFEQSLHNVFTMAKSKGVKLELMPTQLAVYADGDRLVQILVNLLSNAIKFTPPERRVRLSAEELPNAIEFRVQDEGRGIPKAALSTIFDRFKQVQSADAKDRAGFGLGLAICKALVELHGGDITVASEEGVGTTFSFRIPKRATIKTGSHETESAQAVWAPKPQH